ncbi:MAG: serine/threonine-protein phosphatase [Planctomycetota bacterium]|nr:serine/threonine-protein phosphatase [Planctomycetota bacterium]
MPDDSAQHMQCMEVWGGSELTTRNVEMGGLDAWIYSKPFGQSQDGGDVYYASSCATGRINRLLLADVAGHGKAVAETASGLRTLMRRYVNFLDQTEFVRSMNRQFTSISESGCFATAVVTTFFAPTRLFSVCNAGHPRPLLYRATTGQWTLLEHSDDASIARQHRPEASNIPLGIVDLTDYEQFEVALEVGDLVLCYTDALIESRDANGEFLGEDGLLKIINSLSGVDRPHLLIDSLLKAMGQIHPRNLLEDDVTVLLLRPNGNRPRSTFVGRLGATLKVMVAILRSVNPRAERPPLPDFRLANIGGMLFPPLQKRWRAGRRGGGQPAKSLHSD